MKSPEGAASAAIPPDVADRPTYLHNYRMLALDGGLFIGGLAFVNAGTLLPVIVEKHGGPTWLVALVPVLMMVGFQLPPLLVAHHIDRNERHMPLLVAMGYGQRLPYLLAALVLLFGLGGNVGIIAAVALTPLISGLFGGISSTAFSQLFMKQIPERRRASLFAARILIASVMSLSAGYIMTGILDRWPGPTGYGILHLTAFAMLMGSLVCFAWIRETPTPPHQLAPADQGLLDNLRSLPSALRGQVTFRRYLGFRFFRCAMGIMGAFLSVHAVATLDETTAFVGKLVAAQAVGAVLGNLLSAYAGDRWGSKLPTTVGHALYLALAVWSIAAASPGAFLAIFAMFGFANAAAEVGTLSLGLAVCPTEKRSTYLAVVSLVNLAGTLAAAGLATLLRGTNAFTPLALASIAGVAVAMVLLARLRDPRHAVAEDAIEADPRGVSQGSA